MQEFVSFCELVGLGRCRGEGVSHSGIAAIFEAKKKMATKWKDEEKVKGESCIPQTIARKERAAQDHDEQHIKICNLEKGAPRTKGLLERKEKREEEIFEEVTEDRKDEIWTHERLGQSSRDLATEESGEDEMQARKVWDECTAAGCGPRVVKVNKVNTLGRSSVHCDTKV